RRDLFRRGQRQVRWISSGPRDRPPAFSFRPPLRKEILRDESTGDASLPQVGRAAFAQGLSDRRVGCDEARVRQVPAVGANLPDTQPSLTAAATALPTRFRSSPASAHPP